MNSIPLHKKISPNFPDERSVKSNMTSITKFYEEFYHLIEVAPFQLNDDDQVGWDKLLHSIFFPSCSKNPKLRKLAFIKSQQEAQAKLNPKKPPLHPHP